jgi:hypothetical protein
MLFARVEVRPSFDPREQTFYAQAVPHYVVAVTLEFVEPCSATRLTSENPDEILGP